MIIDVQRAIDDPVWARWGARNNPDAEASIARLLAAWRSSGRLVVHVRHDSREPASTYRPGQPGHAFKPEAAPAPGERIVPKHTPSAFVGTDLEQHLRDAGVRTLVIVGVITNNSVEATARHAGSLGFETLVVSDATATFPRPDYSGRPRTAEEVHAMSLANLEGEYASIVTTEEVLARL